MKVAYWSVGWLSTVDGPGNRVVLYLQGCPAKCPWCHSPHSQYENSPLLLQESLCRFCGKCIEACQNGVHRIINGKHTIDYQRCTACGKCVKACPYSGENTANSVLCLPTVRQEASEVFELLRPQLDIVKSIGGITLSGGEALLQTDSAIELLKLCRNYGIHTCVETSMLLPEEVYRAAAQYVDCWLLGFRNVYLSEKISDDIREDCRRKSDIFKEKQGVCLIARFPIIKGYTDTKEKVTLLMDILLENEVKELELLPCNPHTEHYYTLLGKEVSINITKCIPSKQEIRRIADYFREAGIQVKQ
ncbi:MAG: glycyl-radical enzyme activating protein [Lachnospiraceae bacterium]|nr:glycyl-radical enzyme activating protein [Lachnospiraceae bacterium]